jgi:hypothetical protein
MNDEDRHTPYVGAGSADEYGKRNERIANCLVRFDAGTSARA